MLHQMTFLNRVHQLARRFVHDASLRDDLVQEVLLHLCQLESHDQHHEPSWYLQRCRFLILDLLKSGRSLDSPKRRHLGCQLEADSDADEAAAIPSLTSAIDVLQEVSARDIFNVLWDHLPPPERVVLEFLSHGLGDTDIAQQLTLDRSAVARRRSRIASVAISLGIFL